MSFHFSKSKFVSTCMHCDKYAWLDKYKPEEKSETDEFTKSLFDNGHKVGELAKEYLNVDVDVTSHKEDKTLDLEKMIKSDLKKYCALDTFSVVKILKKLYQVCK